MENIYSIRQSYVNISLVSIILRILEKQSLSFSWILQKSFYDQSR